MFWKIRQNHRVARPAAPAAAADDTAAARDLVGQIVDRDEERVGSRELAYETVGRRIGRSASWVYRLTTGKTVGLKLQTWHRIVAAYQAHAEAMARAAEAASMRAAALNREADAIEALRSSRGRPR